MPIKNRAHFKEEGNLPSDSRGMPLAAGILLDISCSLRQEAPTQVLSKLIEMRSQRNFPRMVNDFISLVSQESLMSAAAPTCTLSAGAVRHQLCHIHMEILLLPYDVERESCSSSPASVSLNFQTTSRTTLLFQQGEKTSQEKINFSSISRIDLIS